MLVKYGTMCNMPPIQSREGLAFPMYVQSAKIRWEAYHSCFTESDRNSAPLLYLVRSITQAFLHIVGWKTHAFSLGGGESMNILTRKVREA